MPAIRISFSDKLYRDMLGSPADQPGKYISMENNWAVTLGANPAQFPTIKKLCGGDFEIVVNDDGTMQIKLT